MAKTSPQAAPIPKVYDPKQVEERLYRFWMDGGYFTPKIDHEQEPFVVILPPPNVTGELHVGHALTATIEDALVRWQRMRGRPALWLPGTDHAGIATQVVVERRLAEEGLDRQAMGREAFEARVWEWVDHHGRRITEQHKALGASLDWSRERFTLDDGPSRAVRTTFVNLYNKGLIYRGERLINWSPGLNTAISDLEVEHRQVEGSLWHMRYPLEDGSGHVTVATTRPETYLGDTAVAVNPDDPRFKDLVGKRVRLPIIDRVIPIVADEAVEAGFGTGSVKVTPAHDPTDFEIGQRHGLELINIMNPDATINEHGGPFAGQDRFEARGNIVAAFEERGLLEKVERHVHSVGHCQRSGSVVEPLVSEQWFVKVGSHKEPESIAGQAHRAVIDGRINIVPERFTKVYLNWMENIRDWTISRQLWWGHRIPVYYCQRCGHEMALVEEPRACIECGGRDLEQDPDVLDTWFSSALWPHSTLGWPDDTEDLRYFYPGSVMETGYDILFFWVARMIMMGMENMGDIPFHTVYLHGLIRDETGEKMSKVKGNVVNPLELLSQYGTDALRFALSTGISPGNDSRLTPTKMETARNFANKLWNASRYVLSAVDQTESFEGVLASDLTPDDRWILSRLNRTIARVEQLLEDFQVGEAQREIYDFFWSEYADWYIELAKVRLRSGAGPSPLPVLTHVLDSLMRLLHPFMPFVTEEIWQNLVKRLPPDQDRAEALMISAYPQADPRRYDDEAEAEMHLVTGIIKAIRNARAELQVEQGKHVEAHIDAGESSDAVRRHVEAIETLARAKPIQVYGVGETAPAPERARIAVLGSARVILPMAGLVDLEAERQRLEKEGQELAGLIENIEKRLANPGFTGKAPAAVVERERGRLAEYQARSAGIEARLAELR